ncbi:M15 family metallopeptidase [Flavobacteriaceae bacterium]|jgi:zinc D-Ala-D-Ala carboxypeptidase|nr:M15 family metallopeptidase [Flavobacteriaceae bacterium]MDA7724079.1 M15 family metallopeptidase [Flavobacteriaceae bacterium]MDA7727548.1 M15 family metallopeptidase [Flavobacteriaceae bacterium]MDA7849294.1 M15 family metallopeptidase [Flavobacteriaceae bacterium]
MYKTLFFCITSLLLFTCKKEASKEKTATKVIVKNELKTKSGYSYDKDFVLGKFNYKTDTTFIKISSKHSSKPIYLKKEVYSAFKKMFADAQKEGITLIVVSGTRSFYEQKSIWERKWDKYKNLNPIDRTKKILEYSSMPTTSRHHWGTDLDLINLNNAYFESGKGKKEYEWLVKNANDFGFFQVYTSKESGRTGYNSEKWHWSYLPLASNYLHYYNETISYRDIDGFKGSEFAKKVKIIANYVNGISSESPYQKHP